MPRIALYAGCYTHDSDVAIRVYDASDPSAEPTAVQDVTDADHHSFLAAHPDGQTLYAVSETTRFDGDAGGGIVAYRIDPADGSLTEFDRTSSQGAAPCFVDVTTDGRHLLVANYASGTVAAYGLRPDGGFGDLVGRREHLGSGPHARQEAAHAHCFRASADGTSGFAIDLGIDRVVQYALTDDLRAVGELAVHAGAGPRHLALHPSLPRAFVVCELDCTLVTIDLGTDTAPLLSRDTVSTLPDGIEVGASIAAEVRVHPDGRHVYVSNRGHDSLAIFDLGDGHGLPRPIGHVASGGATPRGFALHPSGQTLAVANLGSDSITVFDLDSKTGMPRPRSVRHAVTAPVCLAFVELDP